MASSKGLDALRIGRAQHGSASPSVEAASGSVPEAVPPMPQGGWQPIETAPRDGTLVELWAEDADGAPTHWRLPRGDA